MMEPEHGELSFRANSFARFAKRYGITSEAQPVDPYGLVDNASLKESRFFLASLSKDGRIYSFSTDFQDYRTSLPFVEDLLEYMANEAAIYEQVGTDVKGFAKHIGQPLEVAAKILRDVHAIVPSFKQFLGPMAYADFIKITEPRGPLPE